MSSASNLVASSASNCATTSTNPTGVLPRSGAGQGVGPGQSLSLNSRPGVEDARTLSRREVSNTDKVSTSLDPTNSLFPMKLPTFELSRKGEELSSPLSPDSVGEAEHAPQPHPLVGGVLSSDPLAPLPPRKIKSHIRTIAQARHTQSSSSSATHRNVTSLSDSGATGMCDPNDPDSCVGVASSEGRGKASRHVLSLGPTHSSSLCIDNPRQSRPSHTATSSVPLVRTTYATPPSSASLQPVTTSGHAPTFSLQFEDYSVCSEADSGRGTKSSLKTCSELDTRSLSHISELSYELDADSSDPSLSLSLTRHRCEPVRAKSSPPLSRQACVSECHEEGHGRSETRSSAPEHHGRDSIDLERDSFSQRKEGEESGDLAMRSLKAFRHNPSLLHQQLHRHDHALLAGERPMTLEQFDDFTDVLLPNMEDFHLDMPVPSHPSSSSHRHPMPDFGHSLFVG